MRKQSIKKKTLWASTRSAPPTSKMRVSREITNKFSTLFLPVACVKPTSNGTNPQRLQAVILKRSPDATTAVAVGARTSPPPIRTGKKSKKIFDRREKSDRIFPR